MATTVVNPSYRQRLAYHAGLLGSVCFIVSMLLLMGEMETRDNIRTHIEQDKRAMLNQVLPATLYDNDPMHSPQVYYDSAHFTAPIEIASATLDGKFSGAVLQSSIAGWGGDIQFILATNDKQEITGIRIISHKETPGLADKIEIAKDHWITRFNGKSLANTSALEWAVKKDGGQFDQFTGATITPRSVVNGIYHSLQFIEQWQQKNAQQAPPNVEQKSPLTEQEKSP